MRKMLKSTKARGEAVIVSDHDGRVERLEVQHDHRVSVEHRAWLQRERNALRRPHTRPLLSARRDGDVVHRLGQP